MALPSAESQQDLRVNQSPHELHQSIQPFHTFRERGRIRFSPLSVHVLPDPLDFLLDSPFYYGYTGHQGESNARADRTSPNKLDDTRSESYAEPHKEETARSANLEEAEFRQEIVERRRTRRGKGMVQDIGALGSRFPRLEV